MHFRTHFKITKSPIYMNEHEVIFRIGIFDIPGGIETDVNTKKHFNKLILTNNVLISVTNCQRETNFLTKCWQHVCFLFIQTNQLNKSKLLLFKK